MFSVIILSLHRGSGFREEFTNISEARSILPRQINLMALLQQFPLVQEK